MIKNWITAFRLRTLPLALASIGLGSFLAAAYDTFNLQIFIFASLTTLFLQILSNLANDYGDSIHGADSAEREGPQRAVQSGAITSKAMFKAMIILAVLSLFSGLSLLYIAFDSWQIFVAFFVLGILAIGAAINYTAGTNPYGYRGLGDIFVFIFFGLVAVLGTFYLHAGYINWLVLLPAMSCGLFTVGVLNINNIRDINSDEKAGKITIPVLLGRINAVRYHWLLLGLGLACSLVYVGLQFESAWQLLFLLVLPLLFINAKAVHEKTNANDLDPFLKQMAMTTLLFVITFGIGQLL